MIRWSSLSSSKIAGKILLANQTDGKVIRQLGELTSELRIDFIFTMKSKSVGLFDLSIIERGMHNSIIKKEVRNPGHKWI